MIEFKQLELDSLNGLREEYFSSISLSQELFVEWIVAKGSCYHIADDKTAVGYFIKSAENVLVEFYLTDSHVSQKELIFKTIIEQYALAKAYCKSFDQNLLTCCHTFCTSSKIIGTLFRDYTKEVQPIQDDEVAVRLANEADIPFLLTFDSELYETPEELELMVRQKMLYLFEKEKLLMGCGYLINVLPGKAYYDIGMWTNPDVRNKGYATTIIAYLKKYCLEHGYTPVCGCAVENTASRKTLERNGFTAKHCLIEFDFG